MTLGNHIPVLLHDVIDALAPRPDGIYVDGTFGAGGYTRAILEAADGCRVVAIDRDPEAAPRAQALSAEFPGRLTFIQGRFGEMARLLPENSIDAVDGVALDIGVSSMQIDEAERGFSFSRSGPLDMRMEKSGPTAADVVNNLEEEQLADIIWRYGEDRMSRRIARAILNSRETAPITSTGQLASIIRSVVRKSKDGIDPATRTFQALRIQVNDELGELRRGLENSEEVLRPGGRLAVVSFHSLEDREVKTFLRARSTEAGGGSRLLPGEQAGPQPTFRLLTRKAVFPSDEESQSNPRARSARLRAAERTDAPASLSGGMQ